MPFQVKYQPAQQPLRLQYDPDVLPPILDAREHILKFRAGEIQLPESPRRYLSPKVKAGRVVTFDESRMCINLPVYAVPLDQNYEIDLERIHTLADWQEWLEHLNEKFWFTDEIRAELERAWRLACRIVFGDEQAFEKLKPGKKLTFPCPYAEDEDGE